MPEPHLRADLQQARLRGELGRLPVDAELLRRPPQQQRVPDRVGGGQVQQPARGVRERGDPPPEPVLDPARQRGGAEAAGELGRAHVARQLEHRERVAARLGQDPLADALVDPPGDHRGQQRASVPFVEAVEPQLREVGQVALRARLADGEHERDRLGEQSPRDEPEHGGGRVVEPLQVVDDAQQRLLLGGGGQQAQHGEPDEEPVRWVTRGQPERDLERDALRRGQLGQAPHERRAQLMQPGVGQLQLGLHARDVRDPEARRVVRDPAQERGLADPRLPADDEHRAVAAARAVQQLLELRPFGGAAMERRHCARSLNAMSFPDPARLKGS